MSRKIFFLFFCQCLLIVSLKAQTLYVGANYHPHDDKNMTAVPNSIRKSAYATLMYGNQMVCGWTWQSMHSGEEQYLEGMLDWDGIPNRKFDEYKKIAAEFKKIEKYFPYKLQAEVGLAFSFPGQIDWYGRGPYENYPDRETASLIGLYNSGLAGFITAYPAPQDNANRCDVRWFAMSAQNNSVIKVTGLQPLCLRAWPYAEEDLEAAHHDYQLPIRNFINLNIDLNIHGVGGDDTWGAKTMEKYTNPGNQPYQYGFILEYAE
ncbi:beta-galactosidase small subunit-related protein [Niastella caeni]|uniref:beta-galactosidase n=1 Tax=Niastella caeni TaxID=2569763 RepID=UPI001AA065FD|nr:beta-galactosidase [Niastella caeni]